MDDRDYILLILKKMIHGEEKLLAKEEKEFQLLPDGTLIIRKKKNKVYYTLKDDFGEHGITKNKQLVYNLLRKQHLDTSITARKTILHILHNAYNHTLESKNNICNGLNLPPYIKFDKIEQQWLQSMKSQNQYLPEQLIYKCNNGLMVRSKSERTIANKLYSYGIIFMYEAPITIGGKTYYPDFTILKKDDTIILWEHNGLMTNDEYLVRSLQKIRAYKKAGYTQHTNLICTEEDDVLDENVLDEIIHRYILF